VRAYGKPMTHRGSIRGASRKKLPHRRVPASLHHASRCIQHYQVAVQLVQQEIRKGAGALKSCSLLRPWRSSNLRMYMSTCQRQIEQRGLDSILRGAFDYAVSSSTPAISKKRANTQKHLESAPRADYAFMVWPYSTHHGVRRTVSTTLPRHGAESKKRLQAALKDSKHAGRSRFTELLLS